MKLKFQKNIQFATAIILAITLSSALSAPSKGPKDDPPPLFPYEPETGYLDVLPDDNWKKDGN